jgi:methionine-rich copper-binding protein CopC
MATASRRTPLPGTNERQPRFLKSFLRFEQLEDRSTPSIGGLNPVVLENQLPGNPQSEWDISGIGDSTLQGFATQMSVNVGETVRFKITDTTLAPYRIDIYRMGYYGGLGARKVGTIASSQTLKVNQANPLYDAASGLVDAGNWVETASWAVPTTATSGVYFARVTREDTGGASHIMFIVRNDSSNSDVLFQTADTTWQAYNNWGGNSFYTGAPAGRAYKISYNRPFNSRTSTFNGRDFVWGAEYPMIRWMESNGYDVSYAAGIDTHLRGSELLEHKVFLSVGHDEYWSGQQRANVEAARDKGVNLMFLSGNEVYWRTRWEPSIDSSATANRTLVCYKESFSNADIDPTNEWTGTFRDPRFSPPAIGGNNPENALTGTIFTVNRGPGGETGTAFTVPAEFAPMRFWRNTSVASLTGNQVATLGDRVLGYEWDEDLDNGFRPAGLVRLSSTTQNVPEYLQGFGGSGVAPGTATHSLTLYRAASGALVFGAGTVQWSWGLDDKHDGIVTTPDPAIKQATVNVLADMGAQPASLKPGQVRATMSTDLIGPNVTISSPALGSSLTAGVPVNITGTASDLGGGVIGSVEISTDGGRTWHRATGRGNWNYSWTPSDSGPFTVRARASDDSANIGAYSIISGTAHYQPTPTTNLVAAYNFNASSGTSLVDQSGKSNNGTLEGATWQAGLNGNALYFDGSSRVTIPDSASLDLTTGLTLSAWVKPTVTMTDYAQIILKETNGGMVYSLYSADAEGGPPAGYIRSGALDYQSQATQKLTANNWAYLSTTYDGTALKTYVNGVLVATKAVSGNIVTSNGALRLGGNSIWGEYFTGLMDDVRIYNRPLSEAELHTDMSTPVGGLIETVAPSGSLTAPANGSNLSGTVSVAASATDNIHVAGVQFLLNGAELGVEDVEAPFAVSWNTMTEANGSYSLSARIRDVAGNSFTTNSVSVTIANAADTTAPSVQFLQAGSGDVAGGTLPLWVSATDNVAVAGVQFKLDGVNLGTEDTTLPYRMNLDTTTLTNGTHTLTAVVRDVAGNLTTSQAVTLVVDNVAPGVIARTPAPGTNPVPVDSSVTATFSEDMDPASLSLVLRDANNNIVPSTVTYHAASRVVSLSPNLDLNLNTVYSATLNAKDIAGNPIPTSIWSYTTSAVVANVTIFNTTDTPAIPFVADSALELGVRFRANLDGFITGIRFYKGVGSSGTHVGKLWSAAGAILASATFTNESSSGWQQVDFDTPVAITANTTYVASYFAPDGGYSLTTQAFASSGAGSGAIRALSSTEAGGNGVFKYGSSGGFPDQSFNNSNYFVDAVFSSSLVDVTPPSLSVAAPSAGATGVNSGGNVDATFSEAVQAATIGFVLRDPSNAVVPATVSYNSATRVATLDPTNILSPLTTYTVTVSGAKDAAENVMAVTSWSFTTAALDTTPPVVSTNVPSSGSTNIALRTSLKATFNEPVQGSTITFTLKDSLNQNVTGTVRYDELSQTVTLKPAADLAPQMTYTATLTGAQDLSGNTIAPHTWTFTTASLIIGASVWDNSATPAVVDSNDTSAIEVGMKFRVESTGYLTGIRFYKAATNVGAHVGHIWDTNGNLLATVNFGSESASGWQTANLDTAIAVDQGKTYIVSYFSPNGRYSFTSGGLTNDIANGPLTALASASAGGNGVFRYGVGGGYPAQSFGSANYWVDAVFSNSKSDVTAPTVTTRSPATLATGVDIATAITATFSEDIQPSTLVFTLKDPSNNTIAANVTYNSTSRVATLAPNSGLLYSTAYTVNVSGARDAANNPMAAITWNFTTSAPPLGGDTGSTSYSVYTTQTPAVESVADSAVNLGVKFNSNQAGYITAVRFYKGAGNTGTHVGSLWSSTGTQLATGTFSNETATGWQTLTFATPVAITANTTYVASYHAPNGGYAFTGGFFNGGTASNGPLSQPAAGDVGGNGVYKYGASGFPDQTFNGGNYWVDVIYRASLGDTTAPTISARTPAANGNGPVGTTVTVTFDEAVVANTIVMELRTSANVLVPGTVSYNETSRVATFTPNAPLNPLSSYTMNVSGAKDPSNNTMTAASWNFTTTGSLTHTSSAEFTAGTISGLSVSDEGGGRLRLASAFRDDFTGTTLSSSWSSQLWSGSGAATVADGAASVSAAMIQTETTFTGVPLEGRVKFGASPFQHFGYATSLNDTNGNSWAIFSTGGSSETLYARVNVNGTTQQVTIGTLSTAYQLYRIETTGTEVKFLIDGTQVATIPLVLNTTAMRIIASDFNGTAPILLDWAVIPNYIASGTLTSVVYDIGQSATIQHATWTAVKPTNTNIKFELSVSADNTNWSSWTEVQNGTAPSTALVGRYVQYRITLESTDSLVSPTFDDISLVYA